MNQIVETGVTKLSMVHLCNSASKVLLSRFAAVIAFHKNFVLFSQERIHELCSYYDVLSSSVGEAQV